MSQDQSTPSEAANPETKRGRKPRGQSVVLQTGTEIIPTDPAARIAQKIVKAIKLTKKLNKTEKSEYGDYAFVSIDDYYEQVALVIARDVGLSWMLSEEPSMEERFQDVSQDVQIRKVYRVIWITDDGDLIDYGGYITVSMPYEGATTAGKMLSYAEKAFMRRTFKIPTGDAEAEDSKPPARSERSQQPASKDKDKFFSTAAKESDSAKG